MGFTTERGGIVRAIAIAGLCVAAACSPDGDVRVDGIRIVGFGILRADATTSAKDPTSTVGASMARSQKIRIVRQTDDIPFKRDTVLPVRIGEVRHIGGRIASGEDDHCVEPPGPGAETFEFQIGGRKLAEKTFELFRE